MTLQYKIELDPRNGAPGGTDPSTPDNRRKIDGILERYLRFEEAARSEKQWINERLGWLFTPQSILFAALGVTFSDKIQLDQHSLELVRLVIPLVGMSICIVGGIVVGAACVMHNKWTTRMCDCVEEYRRAGGDPEGLTFGTKPYWPARWARWSTLAIPLIFFAAWLWILLGAGLYRAHRGGEQEVKTVQETTKQPLGPALAAYVASPLGFAESTKSFMGQKLIPTIQGTGIKTINPWEPDAGIQEKINKIKKIRDLGARKAAWGNVVEILGKANANKIEKADGIVAVLDGVDVDSGTAAEIGYGTALGKWIIGYRGDFRRTGEDEAAEVNLQVEYFIRSNGGVIVHKLDDLASVLEVKRKKQNRE